MLTSKQRAALRGAAGGLQPVFQIGKEGVGETLVKATADCLAARELVKLRVLETSPGSVREVADALAEATNAEVVQVIGRVLVLFRQKKEESAYDELLGKPVRKAKASGNKSTGTKPGRSNKAKTGNRPPKKYGNTTAKGNGSRPQKRNTRP